MFFKDLQKNSPFFVIDNSEGDFKVFPAKVVSVSQPRFDNITQQFSNQVIDLNVVFDNKNLTYTVNETAENMVSAQNGTILILDQTELIRQLKSLKFGCENSIKEGELAKSKLSKIEKSLEEFDVTFKEKKEYDEKLLNLSNQVSAMSKSFTEQMSKMTQQFNSFMEKVSSNVKN